MTCNLHIQKADWKSHKSTEGPILRDCIHFIDCRMVCDGLWDENMSRPNNLNNGKKHDSFRNSLPATN